MTHYIPSEPSKTPTNPKSALTRLVEEKYIDHKHRHAWSFKSDRKKPDDTIRWEDETESVTDGSVTDESDDPVTYYSDYENVTDEYLPVHRVTDEHVTGDLLFVTDDRVTNESVTNKMQAHSSHDGQIDVTQTERYTNICDRRSHRTSR